VLARDWITIQIGAKKPDPPGFRSSTLVIAIGRKFGEGVVTGTKYRKQAF